MLILKGTSVTDCVSLSSPSWFPLLKRAVEYGQGQASLSEQIEQILSTGCVAVLLGWDIPLLLTTYTKLQDFSCQMLI